MGKDSGSAPTPPDPNVVGQAATKSNQQTALYNTDLSRYGINSPGGSVSWSQTPGAPTYDQAAYQKALAAYNAQPATITTPGSGGTPGMLNGYGTNVSGNTIANPNRGAAPTLDQFQTGSGAPSYTQNVQLSPDVQAIRNNAISSISAPVPQPDEAMRDQYQQSILSRVNPQQQWQTDAMNSQLANQGIDAVSNPDAYQKSMQPLIWQQNDEQNQAYQQAGDEMSRMFGLGNTQRDLPLNELNSLQSGGQMPQAYTPTSYGSQAPNTEGNFANQYAGQQDIYNQGVATNNANTAGLYGLGSSAAMMAMLAA